MSAPADHPYLAMISPKADEKIHGVTTGLGGGDKEDLKRKKFTSEPIRHVASWRGSGWQWSDKAIQYLWQVSS